MLPSESAFREISRVVLSSLAFTGIPVLVIGAIRGFFTPSWVPDPGVYIRGGPPYFAAHYQAVAYCALVVLAVAFVLAYGTHRVLEKVNGRARIDLCSAWTTAFEKDCTEGKSPYARVRLDDGSVYAGYVHAKSPDIETEDREIILERPYLRSKPKDGKLVRMPNTWERVVLKGSDIKSISVAYCISVAYWSKDQPPPSVQEDSPDAQSGTEPQRGL